MLLELVIANAIVAGDDDPALRTRLTEPHDVLSCWGKDLVVYANVEPGGAKRVWNLPSSQRTVDEEYEGLRLLAPAGWVDLAPARCGWSSFGRLRCVCF